MLEISSNQKTLWKDGAPFFYLADTCWSAFTNITEEEWDFYLYQRKLQGFNTIQINILPQWDASDTILEYTPFVDGDWYQLNDAYFQHAKKMCIKAKEQGFELALVLLWCNYIPGTWASRIFHSSCMPLDAMDSYVQKVHETFTELHPMYVITGDTDMDTEESIQYYVKGGSLLKKLAPNCLFTAHIKGRYTFLPEELYAMMDVLFYQSGHNPKDRATPYSMSEEMQQKYPGKPLINSEPCYEEMGYSGKVYGRWTRQDVRRAAYMSVLSGACAGVAYGAAGIYSWHKVNKGFMSGLGEAFDTPKTWEQALAFPGAWDYGFLKKVFEHNHIDGITPKQELLLNQTEEIRVAQAKEQLFLIYVPCNTKVKLATALHGWKAEAIDLEHRFIANVEVNVNEDHTTIAMHPFGADALIILQK